MRGTLAIPTMAASNSGEVALMAVAVEVTNVPLPRLDRLSEEVEEVEEYTVELWASWSEARRDSERVRARWGNGDGDGFVFLCASDAREREEATESEQEGRRTWPP